MSVCKGYPGRSIPIYISPLSSDKHTKGSSLGQYLQGTATFAKVIFCIFMLLFLFKIPINYVKSCSSTKKADFIVCIVLRIRILWILNILASWILDPDPQSKGKNINQCLPKRV